jgi:hypothetical protein
VCIEELLFYRVYAIACLGGGGVNLSVFRQAINTTTPAANADNKMFFAVGFIDAVRFLRR